MQKICTVIVSPQSPINITKVGEEKWRGKINRLRWDKAEAIASEIGELVKDCFPDVAVEIDYEFSVEENQFSSGLIIQITSEEDILLEPALTSFLSRIMDQSQSQDLFLDLDDRLQSCVSFHSIQFLHRFAGKNIGTPLKVEGHGLSVLMAGRFSELPRSLPQQHASLKLCARINGFMKSERTLSLRSETEGTLISTTFDLNDFMRQIAEAALNDTVHDFTIQPKENEKGELKNSLTSMSVALEHETLN